MERSRGVTPHAETLLLALVAASEADRSVFSSHDFLAEALGVSRTELAAALDYLLEHDFVARATGLGLFEVQPRALRWVLSETKLLRASLSPPPDLPDAAQLLLLRRLR